MRFWVVKGKPSRNDLRAVLTPASVEQWVTRRPPRDWAPGDGIFIWDAAPALRLVGLAQVKAVHKSNSDGQTFFDLTYLTHVFDAPLTISALRADALLGTASFLKAGAAGTVFPISTEQAQRLLELVRAANGPAIDVYWGRTQSPVDADGPSRALSIRQPWAELILRGQKTIEARSRQTHVRGRVHIYASLGDVAPDYEARVRRVYGLDASGAPRGVLVGSVAIVGCRPLKTSDTKAAGFAVETGTTDFAWLLAEPRRAMVLVKPRNHPQPVFFKPF